jgi:hypothetical protein
MCDMDLNLGLLKCGHIASIVFDDQMVDPGRIRNPERSNSAQLVRGRRDEKQAALIDHHALDLCLTRVERGDASRGIDATSAQDEHVGKDLRRLGIGASNIVPVLFTAAGSQTRMPASLAIAAVTTLGYAGILVGPAAIGFIVQHWSLSTAFVLVAGSLIFVAVSWPLAARR